MKRDDGLATGITAEAALRALRQGRPRRLVLAVPVCGADTAGRLRAVADDVICLFAPDAMFAVGMWYSDFAQTRPRGRQSARSPPGGQPDCGR